MTTASTQEESQRDTQHIDRLLDAIELVKNDERHAARQILRDLISENNNFEDAWLWMSVAVDSVDQSIICLDNVLRINPNNINAATALHRLRISEAAAKQKRDQLRYYRDVSLVAFWSLIFILLFAIMFSSYTDAFYAPS